MICKKLKNNKFTRLKKFYPMISCFIFVLFLMFSFSISTYAATFSDNTTGLTVQQTNENTGLSDWNEIILKDENDPIVPITDAEIVKFTVAQDDINAMTHHLSMGDDVYFRFKMKYTEEADGYQTYDFSVVDQGDTNYGFQSQGYPNTSDGLEYIRGTVATTPGAIYIDHTIIDGEVQNQLDDEDIDKTINGYKYPSSDIKNLDISLFAIGNGSDTWNIHELALQIRFVDTKPIITSGTNYNTDLTYNLSSSEPIASYSIDNGNTWVVPGTVSSSLTINLEPGRNDILVKDQRGNTSEIKTIDHVNTISISGTFDVHDKLYDATAVGTFSTENLSISGIDSNHEVFVNYEPTFTSSTSGIDITVSLDATLTGANADLYILDADSLPTATGNIYDKLSWGFDGDFSNDQNSSNYDFSSFGTTGSATVGQYAGRNGVKFVRENEQYLITNNGNPILPSEKDFTYSLWYYLDAESILGTDRYFAIESSGFKFPVSYGLRNDSDIPKGQVFSNDAIGYGPSYVYLDNTSGSYGADSGKWYNITVTYDHGSKTHTAYLNGEHSATMQVPVENTIDQLILGSYRNKDGRFWEGYIDNFSIWGKVLSTSEIRDLQTNNLYTVTYDGNGHTTGDLPTVPNKYYEGGTSFSIPSDNALNKEGYTFSGWNTKIDGSGDQYSLGDTFTVLSDTVLYAQWEGSEFSIQYNLNGGINDNSNPSVYNVNNSITFNAPTKKGCSFEGWYDAENGGNEIVTTTGKTGDLILYAQWNTIPVAGFGYSIGFDGSDDYVDLGDGVILGETFTQEAWIYPNEVNDNQYRGFLGYEFEPQDTSNRPPSLWSYDKTKLHGGFGGDGHWNAWITQEDVLLLNTWNHVAVSYDGSYYKIYINGNLKETFEMTNTPVNSPIKYIGRVDNYFQGSIDEVRLWNTALSEEVINQWMNRTIDNAHLNYSNLLGYWQFNENNSSSTLDSKNNITGNLMNGPLWETSTIPNRYYVNEGGQTTIRLIGYDFEGDHLNYSIISGPSAGTLNEISTGVYEYTHAGGEVFQDTITYKVNDGSIESTNTATIDIRINPTNDSPSIPGSFTNPSGSALDAGSSITLTWGESSDIEGDSITYTLEYWDGSQWQLIKDNLLTTTTSYEVPNENIDELQWRVKAYDGMNFSDYTMSSIYDIRYTVDFLDYDNTLIEQQNIIYGENATPPVVTREGYSFTGWSVDYTNVKGPISTVAKFDQRTDTVYTVEYYQENLDGTYSIAETELLTGTTDTTTYAPVKLYTNFLENKNHSNRNEMGTIAADGSLVLKLYYNRKTYTVDFLDYNNELLKTQDVLYEGNASLPVEPIRQGYNFLEWVGTYTNIQSDTVLTADYLADEYTPYKVISYEENILDGSYTEVATSNLTGTTDTDVTITFNNKEGFVPNTDKSHLTGTIVADGSLVLETYYDRERYKVEFLDYDGSIIKTELVQYNGNATPPSLSSRVGYNFTGWLDNYNFITSDKKIKAGYAPKGETPYKVEYYLENIENDGYTLDETVGLSGTTDADVNLSLEERIGFTPNNSKSLLTGNIAGDGSLILKKYYDRKTYTVEFLDYKDDTLKVQEVKYQGHATPPSPPNRIGYDFTGWLENYNSITSDRTIKAGYAPKGETPYKVEYYLENIENDEYTLDETVEFSGDTDAVVNLSLEERIGFTPNSSKSIITGNIAADGTLILKKYYDRKTYTVEFLDYKDDVIKVQEVKYQGDATAPSIPNRSGHSFYEWDNDYSHVNQSIVVKALYSRNKSRSKQEESTVEENDEKTDEFSELTELISDDDHQSKGRYSFNTEEVLEKVKNDKSTVVKDRVLEAKVSIDDRDEINVRLESGLINGLSDEVNELNIISDLVSYKLPLSELSKGELVDYEVTIRKDTLVEKEEEIRKGKSLGYGVLTSPINFKVESVINKNQADEKRNEIKAFDHYIERRIKLPLGVNPKKITTGIRENDNGTITHVPTMVYLQDGSWYAKINSLTNSKYTIIWHNVGVESAKHHWAEEAINDMASRLVIDNYNNFRPNEKVTTVEFIDYLTKGLGIYDLENDALAAGENSGLESAKTYALIDEDSIITDNQLTAQDLIGYLKNATKLIGERRNNVDNIINNIASTAIKDKEKGFLTKAEALVAIRSFLIEFELINK